MLKSELKDKRSLEDDGLYFNYLLSHSNTKTIKDTKDTL